MKIFVVLPVSIVLVSILFCPVARAAPPIPDYVQMVEPDPSLPKELSAFFGQYEGISGPVKYFVIIAKIDKENAIIHILREGVIPTGGIGFSGWQTVKAPVFKERGEYQLWVQAPKGTYDPSYEFTLKGKYLNLSSRSGNVRLSRVAMSGPPMPADLKMVPPDPSLPKELSAFFGKWEGRLTSSNPFFLIVEKIDEQKASLYYWLEYGVGVFSGGWKRYEGNVIKERGKYIIWHSGQGGIIQLTLKGEYLDWSPPGSWPGDVRFKRVQ